MHAFSVHATHHMHPLFYMTAFILGHVLVSMVTSSLFYMTAFTLGQVLGSFFYGYILTQIPGGILAQRFGGRWVFGVGIVMTAILTLLTPLAANISVWFLVVVRILEGFFEVRDRRETNC